MKMFVVVFQADGRTRGDLYKLRTTWEGIFPSLLLNELDQTVRKVDHNWPMRSKKRRPSHNPLALVKLWLVYKSCVCTPRFEVTTPALHTKTVLKSDF